MAIFHRYNTSRQRFGYLLFLIQITNRVLASTVTVNFHANVVAPYVAKHRELLDDNKTIQKESGVRPTITNNTPIEGDASRKREQIVEREASSTTFQRTTNRDQPFTNRFEFIYQQANLIGAALRGANSSFSRAQDSSALGSVTVESSSLSASKLSSHIQSADFSAANLQSADEPDIDVQGAAEQGAAEQVNGFAALHPDGFPSYSGKLAQYIYQRIGGVFDPRIVNGAQLVGVDEII